MNMTTNKLIVETLISPKHPGINVILGVRGAGKTSFSNYIFNVALNNKTQTIKIDYEDVDIIETSEIYKKVKLILVDNTPPNIDDKLVTKIHAMCLKYKCKVLFNMSINGSLEIGIVQSVGKSRAIIQKASCIFGIEKKHHSSMSVFWLLDAIGLTQLPNTRIKLVKSRETNRIYESYLRYSETKRKYVDVKLNWISKLYIRFF